MDQILINSFVHINVCEKETLFYNTLNGVFVKLDNPAFANTVKLLLDSTRDNYLLSTEFLNRKEIDSLINDGIGTLIERGNKPIQFIPRSFVDGYPISLYSSGLRDFLLENQTIGQKEKAEIEYLSLMGKNIFSYLEILNIHYSSLIDKKFSLFQHVHRQYLYPQIGTSVKMNIDTLKTFIQDWRHIRRINIVIGDINETDVSEINEFARFLKEMNIQVHIYGCICYENILMKLTSDYMYCWVTSLDEHVRNGKAAKNGYTMLGLICSENDLSVLEGLCGENNIFACNTLQNEDFCAEVSGYELNEITQEIISEAQIRTNTTLNFNLFGSLWIYPDYKVYSCPNDKALGTIVKDTVREILYKEFTVSKSWFKVRLEHESCRHCIYNTLCPPITNYELFLGKTLCNWK